MNFVKLIQCAVKVNTVTPTLIIVSPQTLGDPHVSFDGKKDGKKFRLFPNPGRRKINCTDNQVCGEGEICKKEHDEENGYCVPDEISWNIEGINSKRGLYNIAKATETLEQDKRWLEQERRRVETAAQEYAINYPWWARNLPTSETN